MEVSRRDFIQTALLGGAAFSLGGCGFGPGRFEEDSAGPTLWYRRPAGEWNEALPVGNGRLGAMIFGGVGGGVARERIQLNVDSLWAGSPLDRERKV